MSAKNQFPDLALITGAANGVGYEMARKVMNAGGCVVAVDVEKAGLDDLQEEFLQLCFPIYLDLADTLNVEHITQELIEANCADQKFDFVMLNAAISATGNFEKIPANTHVKIVALNAIGPMIMASKLMAENAMARGSTMVFMSSLSHHTGYPGAASYAASKDALAIYAKSVTREFARQKVNVMRVFPGPIDTNMAKRHAPRDAKGQNRMPAKKVAARILNAARKGKNVLYPDFVSFVVARASKIMPVRMTKLMRRIIFEKLDGETF